MGNLRENMMIQNRDCKTKNKLIKLFSFRLKRAINLLQCSNKAFLLLLLIIRIIIVQAVAVVAAVRVMRLIN